MSNGDRSGHGGPPANGAAESTVHGAKMAMTVWRTGAWNCKSSSDRTLLFEVLPKRWIVERTFAWISHNRRLARDYERNATTVAAFIRLAMIRIMLRRLLQMPSYELNFPGSQGRGCKRVEGMASCQKGVRD